MESKEQKQPQASKLKPEEMPEYQNKLAQSVIQAGRKAGHSDEQILEFLDSML